MAQYYSIFETWLEGEIKLLGPGRVINQGRWRNRNTNNLINEQTVQDAWNSFNPIALSEWQLQHVQSWVIAMVGEADTMHDFKNKLTTLIPDADVHGITEVTSENEQNILLILKDN